MMLGTVFSNRPWGKGDAVPGGYGISNISITKRCQFILSHNKPNDGCGDRPAGDSYAISARYGRAKKM